jgi:antitoxin component YwqK of YwqJK toxin-antitoxin module
MRYILLLLLLWSAPAISQEILEQQYWPDGTLKRTRIALGDREMFITYHENGRINESGYYINGRCDGIWKRYTESGALLLYARFNNGERQGVWEFRNAEDRPMGRLHFSDGLLTSGEQFDDRGQLIAQRVY